MNSVPSHNLIVDTSRELLINLTPNCVESHSYLNTKVSLSRTKNENLLLVHVMCVVCFTCSSNVYSPHIKSLVLKDHSPPLTHFLLRSTVYCRKSIWALISGPSECPNQITIRQSFLCRQSLRVRVTFSIVKKSGEISGNGRIGRKRG